jgi:hypothetical protein
VPDLFAGAIAGAIAPLPKTHSLREGDHDRRALQAAGQAIAER